MLQQRSWSAGVLANDTARGRKSTRLEIFHYSWRSSQFGGIFAQSRGKRVEVYKNHLGCWCAKLGTPPLAEPHVVRSYTRRSHGRHPANQRATSARKVKSKPSPASLRLRGRGKMPDAKSGRFHILRQLAIPGGVAAEDTGNHLLLSVTGRSECCRSGSEISRAGLYQRQGAKGRCRSVEGGWLFNDLKKESRRPAIRPLALGAVRGHAGLVIGIRIAALSGAG